MTPGELLVAYCERIDAGDFDGLGALFAPQGVIADESRVPIACGPSEIAGFYRRIVKLYDGSPRTKHLVMNTLFETEAVARSSYIVMQSLDDFPLQTIITGRYRDTFVSTPGGWLFEERCFAVDLVGDLSRHLDS